MEISNVDLIVVGGGPAGMMCAYTAAKRGFSTVMMDPNEKLGRKLRITGKGRCNLTNNCDIKSFIANIPGDGRFLYSALNRLSPSETISFFEGNGLPLKTERGNRVFPVSDNANDVADLMERLCRKAGVEIIRTAAEQIHVEKGAVAGVFTEKGYLSCRAVAVCTGGLSYPKTGSTGKGYEFARTMGHTITKLRPSLVPLESTDTCCRKMQGFAPKNVTLSVYEDDKLIYRELGEMLFTHFGLSGPLVLSASSQMRDMGKKEYRVSIDFKPALEEKKLDARILRDFAKYSNREFRNALGNLMVSSMIPVMSEMTGIPESKPVHHITREERQRLVQLLKAFPVSICGFRPVEEAIVTAGGVSTKEINPRTMESKLVSGLYFAGEVLDLDGFTGGFNLQIAWSTGYVAGISV